MGPKLVFFSPRKLDVIVLEGCPSSFDSLYRTLTKANPLVARPPYALSLEWADMAEDAG